MKKFKFKLEAVLKERKRLEDLKLKEWSLAQKILSQMVEEKTRMEKRLEDVLEETTAVSSQTTTHVGMLQSMEQFIQGTKIRIGWKKQEIERATKLTEKKRSEYVVTRQKREVIEKLREKKLHEYKNEMRRKEIKEQDELYIMSGNAVRRAMEEEGAA